MFRDFSRNMFIISFKLSGFEMYFVITWKGKNVTQDRLQIIASTHRKVVAIQQQFTQQLQTLTTRHVVLRV